MKNMKFVFLFLCFFCCSQPKTNEELTKDLNDMIRNFERVDLKCDEQVKNLTKENTELRKDMRSMQSDFHGYKNKNSKLAIVV